MMRLLAAAACAASLAGTQAAAQRAPETLEQIEPEAGAWQLEYEGVFGRDGDHGIQAITGLSDLVAVGGEVELSNGSDGPVLEGVGGTMLLRLRDPDQHALGLGALFQGEIDRDGRFGEGEARLIASWRKAGWWLQGDVIARHAREDGASGSGLAFAGSAQHAIGGGLWVGAETSARLTPLRGESSLALGRNDYLGPTLTLEQSLGKRGEVEIGLSWLARIRGWEDPSGRPRLFVQFTF